MEFKRQELKPPSTLALLRQQVREQSDHCDVTIKVGQWEKRFHWCVLVFSPFFEAFYRNRNCIEKSTGIVELHGQSSIAVVEYTIMYLYGNKPRVHINNIGDLLQLAEFFMLPTLKAQCVNWLEAMFSCDTYFKFLQLDSLYDLMLPSLKEYMRENMITLLDKDDAVYLDQATLVELLNDKDLTYVPVDVWFKFLVKWTNADPRRDAYFPELFFLLDFSYVDNELHQVILNDVLVVRLGLSTSDKTTPPFKETTNVVIFPKNDMSDTITCFQLETGKWSIINLEPSPLCYQVLGVRDKASSILYELKNGSTSATEVNYQDLSAQNQNCTTTKLINIENGKKFTRVHKIAIAGSACYLLMLEKVKIKKAEKTVEETMNTRSDAVQQAISREKIRLGRELNPYEAHTGLSAVNAFKSKFEEVTILYKGELKEGQTIMEPIACFKEDSISQLAVDTKDNIALYIQKKDTVIIFNYVHGCIDRIGIKDHVSFKRELDEMLVARETGFLIRNRKQLCCISPVHDLFRERFKVTCVDLPTDKRRRDKYIVCTDFCFRFEQSDYKSNYIFSYIRIDDLVKTTMKGVEWIIEELPESCKWNIDSIVDSSAFLISMPKHLLRCSYNCPHCKPATTSRSYYNDFNDYDGFDDDYDYSPCFDSDDDYSNYYDND